MRRIARLSSILLCVGSFLSACGLTVTAEAQSGDGPDIVAQIPYVTLRNETGDTSSADVYGDERSGLKAGWCGLGRINLPASALEAFTETVPLISPEETLRVREIRKSRLDGVLASLDARTTSRGPTVYTHGFNISFEKGCRRAAVLQDNANLKERFLFFSWPSDGAIFNYTRDETDLYWSVIDLADLYHEMSVRYAPEKINVMGHSLGGRGVALALYDLASRYPNTRINDVVLLAPDMDFENFAKILPRFRGIVNSITIYVTDDDAPLAVSEQLHGYPRLGQAGNEVGRLAGVEVIDLGDLSAGSVSGHLYHIYSAEVGRDLDQVLNGGLRAFERKGLIPVGNNLWRLEEDE